uniref:RNA binding motif protein 5 n=1 Tax=Gopherus evgoodei TaxID=1825980 RepID=A0A8C4WFC7_9SAUR
MGSDKRVSRTERSGRYGSIIDREDREDRDSRSRRRDSDYKRSSEERRSERYDDGRDYDGRDYDSRDYDSPERDRERERERRNSDKSEDGYHSDGDYGEHDYRNDINDEKESKTIMLRGLPITVTENDIRELIESFEGPQPADVRLMKRKTGVSRGFAFVEFYHFQDATSWMEANQKKLVIQGKQIAMHYSNPRPKFEDWLCNKCCLYNFRRRLKCFRCGQFIPVSHEDSEQESVDYYCDSKLPSFYRNIAPHTVVDSIMTALSPYASLAQTQQNRGFAFVQLSSCNGESDASQLLQILQSLQPPLKIDGKTIGVDLQRVDLLLPDGNRVSAFSVASTAIAAAQWSSTQPHSGEGGTIDYSYLQPGQDGYTQYAQYSQDYQQYYQSQAGALDTEASVISGAPVTTTTAAVVSQSPQLYNQQPNSPDSPTQTAQPSTSTQAQSASPTGVVPGTKYAVPDTSTYQYDESSGYYYDPITGLYYDPNSQYYYNALTQQYLYWDGEKETYMPAAEGVTYQQTSAPSSKEGKEKKEKPKSKTAQQIAKDMERWAKSLNKQKENFKNSFQPLCSREEERRESAAADAGFALFEKKGTLSERQQVMPEVVKNGEEENPLKRGLVAAYSGDSDNEEDLLERIENEEEKLTDWKKLACLLCRRQFPNKDALVRHQQLSDLHKQNMDIYRRSRLSEQELEALELREREAQVRMRGAGLGAKGSSYGVSTADSYKDAVRKAMFARFTEME